jgi:threonyl-tRNA synthetase
MERFHGILIEHYAGAFPTWLAPTQVCIVPIAERHNDYAKQIYDKLFGEGIRAQLDDRSESMNYKIREALQDKKIPYVIVVGDREAEKQEIALRVRGKGNVGTMGLDEFSKAIEEEIKARKSTPTIGE